jgi:type IV pilus assembly protein PilQ
MNHHGLLKKAGLLVLLCAASAAGAAVPAAVSHITAVEAVDGGRVAIHGSEKPTFTVFKLSEPARLVIDLTGADVTALPPAIAINLPGVLGISAAQFDEGGRKVGRLVVALDGDVRYDVAAHGNDLVVTVGLATPAAAPAEVPAAVPAKAAAQATAAVPKAAPAAPAAAPVAADPTAPVDPNLVVQRDDTRETKNPAHRLSAVTIDESSGQARVRLTTDGEVARYTLIELQNPGRLALDLHGVTGAAKKLEGKGEVKGVRVAKHEGGVRVVVDGQSDRMATYDVQRRKGGLEVVVGTKAIAAVEPKAAEKAEPRAEPKTALAAVEPKPEPKKAEPKQVETMELSAKAEPKDAPAKIENKPEAKPEKLAAAAVTAGEGGHLDVASRFSVVKAVDLRTDEGKSEIAIVIDGAYKFDVGHPNPTAVVLTIRGVTLPERLERNLDATALGGSVDLISAYHVPEHPGEVKIVATLRAPAKDDLEAHKDGLRWRFGGQAVAQAPAAVATRAGAMASEAKTATAPNVLDDRNYTGRRVDFNVKDIDIKNLLSAVGDISKKNIILADDVKGTVTIKLRNVPWDQALDIILKSKGLGKEEIGNIIRVAPIATLRAEAKEAADAAKVKQAYEPLKVRLIPVNYATAEGMVDKVKDSLTDRGTVSVDKRTNTLIIKDVADSLLRAEGIVRNLDTQTPEVLIESRIVEASTSFSRNVGIQWGGNVAFGPNTGNPTGLIFPSILQVAGAADDSTASISGLNGVSQPNFAVNMPAPIGAGSGGGIGMVLGSAGGAANLNLRLSAAENTGNIKTISSPRVVALDNVESSIGQGVSIPFSQVSASGVQTQFIEAKLELKVTPHVTQEGSIQMKISATNNQPNAALTGSNGQPSISRREAKTEVLVKDGDTTVIGGIYTRQNSQTWNEVPVLSRIPILGWLFKQRSSTDARTELLIFITPRIVNRSQSIVAAAPGAEGNQ